MQRLSEINLWTSYGVIMADYPPLRTDREVDQQKRDRITAIIAQTERDLGHIGDVDGGAPPNEPTPNSTGSWGDV